MATNLSDLEYLKNSKMQYATQSIAGNDDQIIMEQEKGDTINLTIFTPHKFLVPTMNGSYICIHGQPKYQHSFNPANPIEIKNKVVIKINKEMFDSAMALAKYNNEGTCIDSRSGLKRPNTPSVLTELIKQGKIVIGVTSDKGDKETDAPMPITPEQLTAVAVTAGGTFNAETQNISNGAKFDTENKHMTEGELKKVADETPEYVALGANMNKANNDGRKPSNFIPAERVMSKRKAK